MARIRTVKPEFFDDEIVGTWSRDARLLFIGTWSLADDEGILRWQSTYLKSSIFKYDDDLSVGDVEKLMAEITDDEKVFVYVAGKARQRLGYVVNFRKHQKINRPGPGRLPPPNLQAPEVLEMYARRDAMTCHLCRDVIDSENEPGALPGMGRNLALVYVRARAQGGTDHPSNVRLAHLTCKTNPPPQVMEPDRESSRNGSRSDSVNDSVNDSGNAQGDEDKKTRRAADRGSRIPDDFQVTPEMRAWAQENCPGINWARETTKFVNHFRSATGAVAVKKRWDLTWQNWLLKAAESQPAGRGRSTSDERVDMARQAAASVQARIDQRAAS